MAGEEITPTLPLPNYTSTGQKVRTFPCSP